MFIHKAYLEFCRPFVEPLAVPLKDSDHFSLRIWVASAFRRLADSEYFLISSCRDWTVALSLSNPA